MFRPWRFFQLVYHLATGQATNKTERVLKESFRKIRLSGQAQPTH